MFGEAVEYLPVLIRIAALFMVAAALYDYFRRKWANAIVEAVRAAGAESPETAVSTEELERSRHGISRLIKHFLKKEYSPLRRLIKCVVSDDGETQNNNKRKKRSEKLTGAEKWYILPPAAPVTGEENGENSESEQVPESSLPALLRDGGEVSSVWLAIGCVLTVAFAELIIYFLPQIISFFTNISKLGRE